MLIHVHPHQEEAAKEAAKGDEKEEGDEEDAPAEFETLSRSVIGSEDEDDEEAHAEL